MIENSGSVRSEASDGISVVICSHNGGTRLPAALEALASCRTSFPCEIVIVDNASTDGSAEVARTSWDASPNVPFPLRVVSEPKPGLSSARRAGVQAASYEIIVFCDDDNVLAPDYLLLAHEIMQDPIVGAAGGCSVPGVGGELPPILFTYAPAYAVGVQALRPGDLAPELRCLWGAGLVVRRRQLISLYSSPGFPIFAGRTGNQLHCFEDYEICHCLALLGLSLCYDDRLRLTHVIPDHRLQPEYLDRIIAGVRIGEPINHLYLQLRMLDRDRAIGKLALGATLSRMIIRARHGRHELFGPLATFGLTWLMNDVQRRIFQIVRHLTTLRAASVAPCSGVLDDHDAGSEIGATRALRSSTRPPATTVGANPGPSAETPSTW